MVLLPRRVSSEKAGATGLCGWKCQQSFCCRDSLGEGCRFGCLQPTGVQYVGRSPWGGASPDARTCWEPAEGEKEDPLLHPLAGVCLISACSDPCSWACCVASSQHLGNTQVAPAIGPLPFPAFAGTSEPWRDKPKARLRRSSRAQLSNSRSAGRIRPTSTFYVAHESFKGTRLSQIRSILSRSAFLLLSNQC